MGRKIAHFPPSLVAAILLLLPMAIAALNLWMIVRARERATRSSEAISALEYGRNLALHLARQPILADGDMSGSTGASLSAWWIRCGCWNADSFTPRWGGMWCCFMRMTAATNEAEPPERRASDQAEAVADRK